MNPQEIIDEQLNIGNQTPEERLASEEIKFAQLKNEQDRQTQHAAWLDINTTKEYMTAIKAAWGVYLYQAQQETMKSKPDLEVIKNNLMISEIFQRIHIMFSKVDYDFTSLIWKRNDKEIPQ